MTRATDRFEELLQSHEFSGHIIRWVAIFEGRLDGVLSVHFSGLESTYEFYELILSRLSFYEKIEILRKIDFGKSLKSQENTALHLDKLRRLRNALAHAAHMPPDEIRKLRSDKWIESFVLGYPKSIGKEKNALENRLSLLWNYCHRRHVAKIKQLAHELKNTEQAN
ncbi:hypothetical protein [Aquipseudomonas alcaligenes]|uniref:hypothetical protein n=1 Tax=Aquipseudomonas alcaligenes TaxID=43263 RepID=UPI0012E736CD|nr:hypothetical protein [Pseudomonas alcaligenes]